ncbi:DUF4326 domain-containing protein [Mycobacterium eburneum]|nr:DUF4326 domain-containing protein [Mycobacterium eburneum]TDH57531.1 DUF4326 domain-containing protein [Mycobacterium eburneum]
MPERIQLRRTKGWRKPAGAIVVARPGKWGNPFTVDGAIETGYATTEADAREFVVDVFRDWLTRGQQSDWWFLNGAGQHAWMTAHLGDLRGRDLACWCPLDRPCHADVLLELAND